MDRFWYILELIWIGIQHVIVFGLKTIGFVLNLLMIFGLFFIGGAIIGSRE